MTIVIALTISCNKEDIKGQEFDDVYVNKLLQERAERDWQMQYNYRFSPFLIDTTITFSPLKYFEPSEEFIFKSKLYVYENPDSVTITGTKDVTAKYLKYGYLLINYESKEYKLNVYSITAPNSTRLFNIWFRDKTSGDESYKDGRFLKFEKSEDSNFIYTIDFNRLYNPSCAYSELFNCPIPTQDDYLDFEVRAGEKKFYN